MRAVGLRRSGVCDANRHESAANPYQLYHRSALAVAVADYKRSDLDGDSGNNCDFHEYIGQKNSSGSHFCDDYGRAFAINHSGADKS
jgi:hypothetical protein